MQRTTIVLAMLGGLAGGIAVAAPAATGSDDLPLPALEAAATGADAKVALPPVPDFARPTRSADGVRSVRELRVAPTESLDTAVAVRGVITWVYDCATAVRRPGETDRQVQDRIDADPTQCERPKLYIADAAADGPDRSLWVVDVPRPFNKLERERLDAATLASPPPDRCNPAVPGSVERVCPPYKVGDQVLVVGTFAHSSPHSERNSDGLLIYRAMKNVSQKWETGGGVTIPPAAARPARPSPVKLPAPKVPASTPVDEAARAESMRHHRLGVAAFVAKDAPTSISEETLATKAWDDNHLAWYTLGAANALKRDWAPARAAFERAAALRPDAAMYEMWLGVARYNEAFDDARKQQAAMTGQQPADVEPVLDAVDFGAALAHLQRALELAPALWRAHFYAARIFRARGDARDAAREWSQAIAGHPAEAASYIALAELYRRWDYTHEAVAVAKAGQARAGDAKSVAELAYVEGLAEQQLGQPVPAIAAFTRALDAKSPVVWALLHRGETYLATGDLVHARADLEAFVRAAPASAEVERERATRQLRDLATHGHR